MSYIGKIPATGNFVKLDAISVVNGQASYTMQSGSVNFTPESANHMLVSLNGVIQAPITSFSVSGSTITFASALSTGDVINFIMVYGNVLDIGTPSDDTISASKLKTDSVITAKIQDDAVTKAKVNFISDATAGVEVKGDGGSNDGYIQLNCSQNSHGVKIKSPPHSAGQSYTLTLPQSITNDYYLKTDGSGNLSFAQVSSDWVKIAHTNVTSPVSSVDFVHGTGGVVLDSTYRYYKVLFTWRPSTNGAVLAVRVSNSGTFRTSGYLAEVFRSYYSGGTSRTSSSTNILVGTGGTQNASDQRSNGEMTFYNMSDSSLNTTAQLLSVAIDGSGNTENQVNNQIGGGVYASPEAHNGIRIKVHTGNIEKGEFTLYGIKG